MYFSDNKSSANEWDSWLLLHKKPLTPICQGLYLLNVLISPFKVRFFDILCEIMTSIHPVTEFKPTFCQASIFCRNHKTKRVVPFYKIEKICWKKKQSNIESGVTRKKCATPFLYVAVPQSFIGISRNRFTKVS